MRADPEVILLQLAEAVLASFREGVIPWQPSPNRKQPQGPLLGRSGCHLGARGGGGACAVSVQSRLNDHWDLDRWRGTLGEAERKGSVAGRRAGAGASEKVERSPGRCELDRRPVQAPERDLWAAVTVCFLNVHLI